MTSFFLPIAKKTENVSMTTTTVILVSLPGSSIVREILNFDGSDNGFLSSSSGYQTSTALL